MNDYKKDMSNLGHRWLSTSKKPSHDKSLVDVWSLSLIEAKEIARDVEYLLSDNELVEARKIIIDNARDRYIAVHGILRIILAGYLHLQPIDIQISLGIHGKPYIRDAYKGASPSFSISRSEEIALFAFSYGRRVGIDVERVRDLEDLELVLDKTLSPKELDQLCLYFPLDRREGFFHGWTIKEAYLKAIGEGISRDLRDIEISIDIGELISISDVTRVISPREAWRIETLKPANDYVGALAVEGLNWQLNLLASPLIEKENI